MKYVFLRPRFTFTIYWYYKVVQIWPGLFVCKQVTVCPGHIWTTLYFWMRYRVSIKRLNKAAPPGLYCWHVYWDVDLNTTEHPRNNLPPAQWLPVANHSVKNQVMRQDPATLTESLFQKDAWAKVKFLWCLVERRTQHPGISCTELQRHPFL
jgi:hypothetical protein